MQGVEPEAVLGNLVVGCIEARDHPAVEERDAAVEDLALVLEDIVRKRLGDELEQASLDGIKTLTVDSDGATSLYFCGAFYLLEVGAGSRTRHRMLPMEADLSVEPGAFSIVKVAGPGSVFEMPQSERQFVRGLENAIWRHRLRLRLAVSPLPH